MPAIFTTPNAVKYSGEANIGVRLMGVHPSNHSVTQQVQLWTTIT